MINLRYISAVLLSIGDSWPNEKFMSTTTEADLKQAEKDYDEWLTEQNFTIPQVNKAYEIIAALAAACEQKAHEDGFRLGVRLMAECLK